MERQGARTRIGNYRVEEELGQGVSWRTYRVAHAVLPRRAVVKTRPAEFAVPLLREACLVEALRHPGIPCIYESGVLPDRTPWLAYEAFEGQTLAELMAQQPLPVADVIRIVRELADVLIWVHRRGVVHRGLRPDRIVITSRMFSVCVTDWSDARAHDAAQAKFELTPGSHPYIAPELVRDEPADNRTDVFALGVIAYQALTGTLPFSVSPGTPVLVPHIATLERRGDMAPDLAELIDMMLSLSRFDRPTASEVRAALDAIMPSPDQSTDHSGMVMAPDVSELETAPIPFPRLRQPRWTPQGSYVGSEHAKEVSGEIIVPTKNN
jgi:eukaryotic-like serine/threonine-protein kinase